MTKLAGNQSQVLSDFTASAARLSHCLPEERAVLKGVDKELQNSLWRPIAENWLFANAHWISVNTVWQMMHFRCTGNGLYVCDVWELPEDIRSQERPGEFGPGQSSERCGLTGRV